MFMLTSFFMCICVYRHRDTLVKMFMSMFMLLFIIILMLMFM
jgi:hypothetical protein